MQAPDQVDVLAVAERGIKGVVSGRSHLSRAVRRTSSAAVGTYRDPAGRRRTLARARAEIEAAADSGVVCEQGCTGRRRRRPASGAMIRARPRRPAGRRSERPTRLTQPGGGRNRCPGTRPGSVPMPVQPGVTRGSRTSARLSAPRAAPWSRRDRRDRVRIGSSRRRPRRRGTAPTAARQRSSIAGAIPDRNDHADPATLAAVGSRGCRPRRRTGCARPGRSVHGGTVRAARSAVEQNPAAPATARQSRQCLAPPRQPHHSARRSAEQRTVAELLRPSRADPAERNPGAPPATGPPRGSIAAVTAPGRRPPARRLRSSRCCRPGQEGQHGGDLGRMRAAARSAGGAAKSCGLARPYSRALAARIAVSVEPGLTALAVTPVGPSSTASARIRPGDAGLGCAVGGEHRQAAGRGRRRDGQEPAAARARPPQQRGHCGPGQVQHAAEVDVEYGRFLHRSALPTAGRPPAMTPAQAIAASRPPHRGSAAATASASAAASRTSAMKAATWLSAPEAARGLAHHCVQLGLAGQRIRDSRRRHPARGRPRAPAQPPRRAPGRSRRRSRDPPRSPAQPAPRGCPAPPALPRAPAVRNPASGLSVAGPAGHARGQPDLQAAGRSTRHAAAGPAPREPPDAGAA